MRDFDCGIQFLLRQRGRGALRLAAVVIGGTSILGGSGKYIGTIAGVIIVRLLDGALNIVQVPPATKDIIFGLVILTMLFLYGRGEKVRE